jgi:hypothetical protein
MRDYLGLIWVAMLAAGVCHAQTENPRMRVMARDLGVACGYCHLAGTWRDDSKPQFAFTIRMTQMQDGLNGGTLRGFGGVTCWTCHRGKAIPARMPRASWQDLLAKWPASLKLSEADARKPAEEVYRNIQSLKGSGAGGLAMTMSVFAGALGVSCDYCHIEGEWESDARAAKRTARTMLGLFAEIPRYFESSRQPGMQCYTCHQGAAKPQRGPAN